MFHFLPVDCFLTIVSFCIPEDIASLEACCKYFSEILNSEQVWDKLLVSAFGLQPAALTTSTPRELCLALLLWRSRSGFFAQYGGAGYERTASLHVHRCLPDTHTDTSTVLACFSLQFSHLGQPEDAPVIALLDLSVDTLRLAVRSGACAHDCYEVTLSALEGERHVLRLHSQYTVTLSSRRAPRAGLERTVYWFNVRAPYQRHPLLQRLSSVDTLD